MTSLERLRLAVALAHSIAGAELRLTCGPDDTIVVSDHPAADLTTCAMRSVVIANECRSTPDYSARISSIQFGGSLDDVGGGVLRTRTVCGMEQRSVATVLAPDAVVDVLDRVGGEVPDDAVHANVRTDAELGVTVFTITAIDRRFDAAVDEIITAAAAACFTAELLRAAAAECPDASPTDDRSAGGS